MLRSRSRCPVLIRIATMAPTTRMASKPSRRMMRNDCQNASTPLPAGAVSATISGIVASIASRTCSACLRSLPRTAVLNSANRRSIVDTRPGFLARAVVSSGSKAMYASNALSRASPWWPLRTWPSACSSSERTVRRAVVTLALSPVVASACALRSFIGSVRRYATMLATCASDRSFDGGIAEPGTPSRTTAESCSSLRST